jgi:hypothetical protein
MWLKRFKVDSSKSTSLGRMEVLKKYVPRIEERDKSVISRIASKYRFESGKKIRRHKLNGLCSLAGLYN